MISKTVELLHHIQDEIKRNNVVIQKLQYKNETLVDIEWRLESAIEKDKEPTQ